MKKLAMMLVLCGLVYADFEGVVERIDDANKTITVNGSIIKVLPQTRIKEDSCWLPWDVSKVFSDLKVGDIVEIDMIHHNNIPTASKIEIQCVRNRAY